MRYLLAGVLVAMMAGGAFAASPKAVPPSEQVLAPDDDDDDDILSDELIFARERGRKDAREVLLPQPTYGPSTPFPFCNPASPICP